jgi:hypothetical protein
MIAVVTIMRRKTMLTVFFPVTLTVCGPHPLVSASSWSLVRREM